MAFGTQSADPEDREAVTQQLSTATEAQIRIDVVYRNIHPVKGVRQIMVRADCHSTPDQGDRYVGIVWMITDGNRLKTELAHVNQLLDDVIEQMDQGLALFHTDNDDDAKLVLNNKRFLQLIELPVSLQQTNITLESFLQHLKLNLQAHPEDFLPTQTLKKKPWHASDCALIVDAPSGRVVRLTTRKMDERSLIITFSDITDIISAAKERGELTDQLNHGQRLKSIGELTGGIEHDFNNLLAIISGNSELLQAKLGTRNRSLNAIRTAAQRGAELTQSLLAFSRKQTLKPNAIDIPTAASLIRTAFNASIAFSRVS